MKKDYLVKNLLYQELDKIQEEKIQLGISKGHSSKIIDDTTEFLSLRKQSKLKIIKS